MAARKAALQDLCRCERSEAVSHYREEEIAAPLRGSQRHQKRGLPRVFGSGARAMSMDVLGPYAPARGVALSTCERCAI